MELQILLILAGISFPLGIACGLYSDLTTLYKLCSFFIVLAIIFSVYKRKYTIKIIAVLLFIFLGIFFGYKDNYRSLPSIASTLYHKQTKVQGYVEYGSLKNTNYFQTFTLHILNSDQNINKLINGTKVQVYIKKHPNNHVLKGGELVSIKGCIQPASYYKNPGNFDLQKYYFLHNTIGKMQIEQHDVQLVGQYSTFLLNKHVQAIVDDYNSKLNSFLPAQHASIVQGLIIGGRADIPRTIWQDFASTGLIHILSISGMHTTLIAGIIFATFRKFINDKLAASAALVFLTLYVLLAGATLPVVRAGIMSALVITGIFVNRQAHYPAIFIATVLVMLAYKPSSLLDLSFQLTCLATGALIFGVPPLYDFLKEKYLNDFVALLISSTIAVQLAIFPILSINFHHFSWLSLFSNALLVPIFEVCIIGFLLGSLLLWVYLPLAKIFIVSVGFIADFAIWCNSLLAKANFAISTIAEQPLMIWFIYYFLLLMFLVKLPLDKKTYRKQLCATLLVLLIVSTTTNIWLTTRTNHTQLHFIDVGQGDACLVTTSKGSTILIDTGGNDGNWDLGSNVLLPYLRYLGVKQIDLLILSHGHNDHSQAALSMTNKLPIKNVLFHPNCSSTHIDELKKLLPVHTHLNVTSNKSLQLDDCTLEILHVPSESKNDNDSLVLKLNSNGYSAIFTGDIEQVHEQMLVGKLGRANILKVAHHGSKTSTSDNFMREVNPNIAIISCGTNNKFGHPNNEVLDRLNKHNTKIWRTDIYGRILLTLTTEGVVVSPYMNN